MAYSLFNFNGDNSGAMPWSASTSPQVQHSNQWMEYPGAAGGAVAGSFFGMPTIGAMAGKNAGATAGDLFGGNINGLGVDVSQNLPPGFQAAGMGGLLNGATGLPLAGLFGLK